MVIADLGQAVRSACQRPEALAAVGEVYARLQGEIDARRPVCEQSGRCCRFAEYGHRLYVTTIELAAFVGQLSAERRGTRREGALPQAVAVGGCPFHVDRLCSVHSIRPFGCRVFFCDPSAQEWQQERYERFHAEIKRLHEAHGVPYFYVEWRQALAALGL